MQQSTYSARSITDSLCLCVGGVSGHTFPPSCLNHHHLCRKAAVKRSPDRKPLVAFDPLAAPSHTRDPQRHRCAFPHFVSTTTSSAAQPRTSAARLNTTQTKARPPSSAARINSLCSFEFNRSPLPHRLTCGSAMARIKAWPPSLLCFGFEHSPLHKPLRLWLSHERFTFHRIAASLVARPRKVHVPQNRDDADKRRAQVQRHHAEVDRLRRHPQQPVGLNCLPQVRL